MRRRGGMIWDGRGVMAYPLLTRLAFQAKITVARALGLWKFPVDYDSTMTSELDCLVWFHNSAWPVTRAEKGSGLESFFARQRLQGSPGLPPSFVPEKELVLSAAGDLMANGLVEASGEAYLEPVADLLFDSDLSFANLESALTKAPISAAALTKDDLPKINATEAEYAALTSHGGRRFDVLQLANNHTLDRGREGVETTLARLLADGIAQAGINPRPGEGARGLVVERGGLMIGIVAATDDLNGRPQPEDHPALVTTLSLPRAGVGADISMLREQIGCCRAHGCDLVVAALHWGDEWEFYPRQRQVETARALAEAGADLVIGGHAHVIQPMEWYRTRRDPGRYVPILYSLGNLSPIVEAPFSSLSLVARVTIARGLLEGERKALVRSVDLVPVVMRREQGSGIPRARIQRLREGLDEGCAARDRGYLRRAARYADLILGKDWRAPRGHPDAPPPRGPDSHWAALRAPVSLALKEIETSSRYLSMRDGTRIAIDVSLPRERSGFERFPTMVHGTRYFRRMDFRWPFDGRLRAASSGMARRFLGAGYAWVNVDARGSGASEGSWAGPWSADELADYGEVLDWIASQPWSDGSIGAIGISYGGTSAERMAGLRHPALKAVAPLFSLFDLYADIACPGGVRLRWFLETWQRGNAAIDRNRPQELAELPSLLRLAVKGVAPVDADRDGASLARAVSQHRHNWDSDRGTLSAPFRGDRLVDLPGISLEDLSPHARLADFEASGVAVYSYSGWFDGSYSRSAALRHRSLRNPFRRLTLGPWNHGGSHDSSPGATRPSSFDHAGELLRFFDTHVRGIDRGLADEAPVHYFTMVENRWKESEAWPPPSRASSLYLAPGNALAPEPPAAGEGSDDCQVDYESGTGARSRWNTLNGACPVVHGERAERDRGLLVYDSEPLEAELEVTGHPLLELHFAATSEDACLFAYLEDLGPDGRVELVTESSLRALHRETSPAPYAAVGPYRPCDRAAARCLEPGVFVEATIEFIPTSYLFRAGHRIRLAIAGADSDHFEVPNSPQPRLSIARNQTRASRLILPIATGAIQ